LVNQIFDVLDTKGVDAIDPQTLIAHYDADRHPEVLSRLKSADEVMKEFLDTFDVGGSYPGQVTRDEFVRYYTNVAASCIDGDEYFETTLRNVWHLSSTINSYRYSSMGSRGGVAAAVYDDGRKEASWSGNQSSVANRLRQAQTTDAQARAASPTTVQRRPSSANGEWEN